jgi:hypothetical protein
MLLVVLGVPNGPWIMVQSRSVGSTQTLLKVPGHRIDPNITVANSASSIGEIILPRKIN